MMFRNIIID